MGSWYPLVNVYSLRHRKWPSRNSIHFHSMVIFQSYVTPGKTPGPKSCRAALWFSLRIGAESQHCCGTHHEAVACLREAWHEHASQGHWSWIERLVLRYTTYAIQWTPEASAGRPPASHCNTCIRQRFPRLSHMRPTEKASRAFCTELHGSTGKALQKRNGAHSATVRTSEIQKLINNQCCIA